MANSNSIETPLDILDELRRLNAVQSVYHDLSVSWIKRMLIELGSHEPSEIARLIEGFEVLAGTILSRGLALEGDAAKVLQGER